MSREFEVRTADNQAVRVLAEDEVEALDTASGLLEGEAEGSVYAADAPVGADGDDPEEGLDAPDPA